LTFAEFGAMTLVARGDRRPSDDPICADGVASNTRFAALRRPGRRAEALCGELREVAWADGFVHFVGHGVEGRLIQSALSLSELFFALPEFDKFSIGIDQALEGV
jgi:hypothetical protein